MIAVDRQERMGDAKDIQEMSAVEYLAKEKGLKIFSIQNIKTIYDLIKDSLGDEMRRIWIDYYNRYGTISLE